MQKRIRIVFTSLLVCILALPFYFTASTLISRKADAQCWMTCFYPTPFGPVYVNSVACAPWDCIPSALMIPNAHSACVLGSGVSPGCFNPTRALIPFMADELETFRDWLLETFTHGQVFGGMRRMARQLNAISMHQAASIGAMMDAQHHMESQRLFKELQLTAHEDYRPSESFCTFGTAVSSLAHTESAANTTALALSKRQLDRQLGVEFIGGAEGANEDKKNRWQNFRRFYCDPQDNNWTNRDADSGLASICIAGPQYAQQVNIDVDYTRALENRRTLNIYGGAWIGSGDEIDLMALGNNLYGHDVLTRNIGATQMRSSTVAERYMDLRAIAAKRSVAENSFNAIASLKSMGSTGLFMNNANTNKYLGRILQDLGIPEDEIVKYVGLGVSGSFTSDDAVHASYFAVLEILAKKIYQNPTFFAQLYDTPANVKRKSAAMKAIDLMLDRAIYESQLRREMALSVLLSSRLEKYMQDRPSIMWGE